jgi:hypothetical protein
VRPGKGTTAAGLGWSHQQARKAAVAALVDGEECPLCGWPMYRDQRLDLDHEVPRVHGGGDGPTRLAHSRCNRSAGASMGNRLRGQRRHGGAGQPPARPTSRDW